ncbi:hypothetical protein E8E13_000129 [Curvularia kusanoi]|uniref:BTB domain-containing protein n=1 Tax=Curvularia kusanoi TaxID=90978 RepID=A0A9P4T3B9_CURKU|nr:hypothetical protein E8E13_000129 [Curvularia kusanoi]
MAEVSQKLLLATFRNLLVSGDFSDFSIICSSDIYKVHKNIVGTRTGFIARAIKFGGKETKENTLDLSAKEAATIKLLIQYLYEADYKLIFSTFTDTTNAGNNKSPQTAPHTCSENPRNFPCEHYNESRHACLKFWDEPEFAQAAYHAYTTTPDHDMGLRNIVSSTLSNHMGLLLKEEVEDLMVEFNGLAFSILRAKAKEAGWCGPTKR